MDDHRKTSVEKNLDLHKQVDELGGSTHINPDSYLPIEIENKFLEHVLAFENATKKPVCEVLKIKLENFPDESALSDEQIKAQLTILEKFLYRHNIIVDFLDRVPMRIAYQHIREFLFEDMEVVPGMGLHLDGCSGNCEDCWQLEWCEPGKGMVKEWRSEE